MALSICKQCGLEVPTPGRCPQCGGLERVVIDDGTDSLVGRVIAGRYRLERRIGKGGMGSVYEATQVAVGNKVAVKFLNDEYGRDPELARRFLHEARTYIRIAHPGAIALHDFGQDPFDGRLYIAMDYIEGGNLKALLDHERHLSLTDTANIVVQVAEVLGHAHSLGVVHRDLKPENVMVRRGLEGFHVKVLDFGVAQLTFEGISRITQAGAVAGTPRYMAPEQLRSQPVDARADVFALGLLAFEMLTGVPALTATDLTGLMSQQLTVPLRRLDEVDPALHSPEIDAVLAKATAKDKEQRYPDMHAFAMAFAALARSTPNQRAALAAPASVPGPVVPTYETGPTFVATPLPARTLMTPAPTPEVAATTGASRANPVPLLLGALLVLALGGGGAGLWALRTPSVVTAAASKCPSLDLYDPQYTSLSTEALEARVRAAPYLMPSAARKQLDTLRASRQTWAEAQRDCMYRSALVGMVANTSTVMNSQPALWGHTRTPDELRTLFLELPTTKRLSLEHKQGVLRFIDKNVISSLKVEDPGDRDWWRQMYYGLQLTCAVTDEALARLGTTRPGDCPDFPPEPAGK